MKSFSDQVRIMGIPAVSTGQEYGKIRKTIHNIGGFLVAAKLDYFFIQTGI